MRRLILAVILILSALGMVSLVNAQGPQEIKTLEGHTEAVISLAFFPEGRLFISSGRDETLRVWDMVEGEELYKFNIKSNSPSNLAISKNGRYVIVASGRVAKILDLKTGQEIKNLAGHISPVSGVAISPSGKLALTSDLYDGKVRLFDVQTGQEIKSFTGHRTQFVALAFSPDERYILSGGFLRENQYIKVWDIQTGGEILSIPLGAKQITSIHFSPDGKVALSADEDGVIKIWDLKTGKALRSLAVKGAEVFITSLAISPDGSYVVSGDDMGNIILWDLKSQKSYRVREHGEPINALALSPDGKYLISGSDDQTIKVWKIR